MAKSKSALQSQLQVAIHKVFDMTKLDISKELMSKKYTNQNLQNQKIMKHAIKNKEEIKRLNKIIKDKDEKITQIQTKVGCQEAENYRLEQQIKELQQKEED